VTIEEIVVRGVRFAGSRFELGVQGPQDPQEPRGQGLEFGLSKAAGPETEYRRVSAYEVVEPPDEIEKSITVYSPDLFKEEGPASNRGKSFQFLERHGGVGPCGRISVEIRTSPPIRPLCYVEGRLGGLRVEDGPDGNKKQDAHWLCLYPECIYLSPKGTEAHVKTFEV